MNTPTQKQVEDDIVALAKKLGLDPDSIRPFEDKVYDEMLKIVKITKRPATTEALAAATGRPAQTVKSALQRLIQQKRAVRICYGKYLPRV